MGKELGIEPLIIQGEDLVARGFGGKQSIVFSAWETFLLLC